MLVVITAIWVVLQISDVLRLSIGGLVALGFGVLVTLTVSGAADEARGTAEDVTLRVARLRSCAG